MLPTVGSNANWFSSHWMKKSGAEKKTSTQVLVQAADLRDAVKKLDEGMKGTMADYQIASVAETSIMDVYPYDPKETEGDNNTEVSRFINRFPEGQCTEVTIGGKSVIIDKTGNKPKVIPNGSIESEAKNE